jgi:hypothetical protein
MQRFAALCSALQRDAALRKTKPNRIRQQRTLPPRGGRVGRRPYAPVTGG